MKILQLTCCILIILNSSSRPARADNPHLVPVKRPFCNAFTGCGMKRGIPDQQQQVQHHQQEQQQSLGSGAGVHVPLPLYRQLLRLMAQEELGASRTSGSSSSPSGMRIAPLVPLVRYPLTQEQQQQQQSYSRV